MSNKSRVDLATNAGAGNGAECEWRGGQGLFMAEATWGGGSAKLQMKSPNGTWIDVPSASLTANGMYVFNLPQCDIRVVIATATACYAYAVGTGN